MSYERAEAHNCSDGNICYGHKVTIKYVKTRIEGQMSRETYCTKCDRPCESEYIAPHKEFRN